jgi:hypothetical protein
MSFPRVTLVGFLQLYRRFDLESTFLADGSDGSGVGSSVRSVSRRAGWTPTGAACPSHDF